MEQAVPVAGSSSASSGLRAEILTPLETLAQSISTIAPTTSPTMTVPLVFALAGNGTWLSYLIATGAILLIALCISRFARYTSNAGSLYTYATSSLPPGLSNIAGWALLLAYIATGAAVVGGFINYANVFLQAFTGRQAPTVLLGLLCTAVATWIAYRDVQVSARLMLWIEAASVTFIAIVLAVLVWKTGLHIDPQQAQLRGVTPSAIRLGVVMALFSFCGFESATTLGDEAANPLRTIPRAVIQSAVFCGLFFVLCAYLETLGIGLAHQDLGRAAAPFRVLADLVGVSPLGPLIDFGALVSMFACTLACITATARVLMRMAHDGLAHSRLGMAHEKNATPSGAVIVSGVVTALIVSGLAARGVSGIDIYGWMGALSVFGFMTTYGLAIVALPVYLRRRGHLTKWDLLLCAAAGLAIIFSIAGMLYPVPEYPLDRLPYLYLIYIACGMGWYWFATRTQAARP
jgi:amino acid transporter